jgi:hypothetical protein
MSFSIILDGSPLSFPVYYQTIAVALQIGYISALFLEAAHANPADTIRMKMELQHGQKPCLALVVFCPWRRIT